uniref:CUB domain-containing protein n=1 Tax=Panagrolaimus davidi TaxID=227884 RepID=A0A914P6Z9_9BILA
MRLSDYYKIPSNNFKNPRLFSLQYEWTKDLAWKGFTYTISRNLSYSMLNHFVSFIPDADLSQQGYLIFDKGYDNYPLESISDPNIITTDMELQGYISIVKNTREKISVTCIAVEQADAIYWNSPESGFGNNMHCQYSLSLPPNNLVVITPNIFTEYWTDIIQYTIDQNPIKTIMPGPIQYFIPSDKTKTRNVLFEYISDGSFKSAGFSVELELVRKCLCCSKNQNMTKTP